MNTERWPFFPDHITKDGPLAKPDDIESLKYGSLSQEYLQTIKKRRENLKKLTGIGIISNAYLEGLQTTICVNLGNPTTVIEFSPEGEPVRTDSKILSFSMHDPCKIFRCYTDEKICLECDNNYALLFWRLSRDGDLVEKIKKRIEASAFISSKIEKGHYCRIVPHKRRPYLEYDCSALGYRELVFPIFVEEKVIAVFFLGQLCLKGHECAITKQQEAYFEKPDAVFAECVPDNNTRMLCAAKVKAAHEEWVQKESNIMSDYEAYINKAVAEIEGVEKILEQEINIKRGQYIGRHIDQMVETFSNQLWNEPVPSEEKWKLLWQNTDKRIDEFVRDFLLEYVIVFANQSLESESGSLLDVVSKAGEPPRQIADLMRINKFKYDITKIPKAIRQAWITSVDEPRLFNGVNSDKITINKEHNLIQAFPVPYFPDATVVVLVGYSEYNFLHSIENRPYEQLREASKIFYALILSTFSATLANIAEERRQKALGRMAHELRVPIFAIQGAADSIIDAVGTKPIFDQDYPGDIFSWAELMTRIIENADVYRYIHKHELEIIPERVFLLTDVITSAVRQVKLLLKARNFSPNRITYIGFEGIPELWLDRNRFQQVMFNILANSIKYAYEDPEVFDVEIEAVEKGEHFYIYIRDWGTGIEESEKEKIFEEEFRSAKAIDMNVTGQGLGLWIVRQIIEKHGGKIRVSGIYQPTELEIQLPYWLTSRKPN